MNAYNRKTLVVGVLIALAIAGVVSYFASVAPDGLEKTQEELGSAEPVHKGVEPPPSIFEEYRLAWLGEGFWGNAVAGIAGSLLVLGLVLAAGYLLKRRERRAATRDAA
jgi:cobalt/nickel transport protein